MELSASEQQAQWMESQLQQQIIRFFKYFGVVLPIWILGYFGFSVSWLLMAVLAYVVASYIKSSRQARTAVARKLALDEKSFLGNLDNLPSWVFFPDVERAEWMNMMILQAWPFIRGYVVDMINTSVIPNVKANLPPTFSTFKFTNLDLGDCAPRIGGIKVFKGESIRRSEVVMDVDLMYFGDCNIEVKWKTFKAGITNVEFRGKARVVISPLMSRIPIVGSISLTLLNNPYINFDLTNIGNVLDMPGLRQLLVRAITDQVASLLVLPKKIVVPLASDIDLSQIRFPLPQGVLHLHVIEAKDLEKLDIGFLKKGKSDPYVTAKVGQQAFRTKTIENNVTPKWDEKFEALVHVRSGQALEMEVFDEDPGSKDDPLGSASVDLEAVSAVGTIDCWVKLEDAKSGLIHVRLAWANLLDDPICFETQNQASLLSKAFLSVEVDSCRGLPSLKHGREPSALVTLSVGGGKEQSTQLVEASPNPVFEEAFNFLVGNPTMESLCVTVYDQSVNGERIGQLQLQLRSLLSENQMQLSRRFVLDTGRGSQAQITMRLALRALVEGRARNVHPESMESSPAMPARQPGAEASTPSVAAESFQVGPNRSVSSQESPLVEERSQDPAASFTIEPTDAGVSSEVRQRKNTEKATGYGQIQLTLRFSSNRQCLVIAVHQAKDLVGQDEDGFSDPYVKLHVITAGRKSKNQKTKHVKNSLNPVYDESFEIPLSELDLKQTVLHIRLVNHVGKFSRKSMGSVEIALGNFQQNATAWYEILACSDADSGR